MQSSILIYSLKVKSDTPILMCSVPGYDASGRVDDLATQTNKKITSIAIGKFIFHLKTHTSFSLCSRLCSSLPEDGRMNYYSYVCNVNYETSMSSHILVNTMANILKNFCRWKMCNRSMYNAHKFCHHVRYN